MITTINYEECSQHHLPKAEIQIDASSIKGGTVTKFPNAHTYFVLSGPPGGPLSVSLEIAKSKPKDDQHENVELAGAKYPASSDMQGTSAAARATCAVLVSAPHNAVVIFEIGSRTPMTCKEVLSSQAFAKIRESLKISFAPKP